MGRKQVQVSGEAWQEICTVGWQAAAGLRCIAGLPEGAVFCHATYENYNNPQEPKFIILSLIFEHPDWPALAPGDDMPVVDVILGIGLGRIGKRDSA